MEIKRMLFTYKGEDWINNWRCYFFEVIQTHMYNLPVLLSAPVLLEEGYCYLKDANGEVIRESGISMGDLMHMGDILEDVMYAYNYLPLEKKPWGKIGYEVLRRFRIEKRIRLEEEAREKERLIGNIEKGALEMTLEKKIRDGEVYVTKSGEEWVDLGLASPDRQSLWLNLWREGEICFLFADSNIGKTIYALQMGLHIAEKQKVLYFDYEMDYKDFQIRFASRSGRYAIPANFKRCEPNRDIFLDPNAEEILVKEMEKVIEKEGAKVIIIDNLTYISKNAQSGTGVSVLMYRLKILQKKHGLSMLILAHTPKRNMRQPLTQNDLAGSKKLFNFTDSVFAIGQSVKDKNLQYLKQLKSRGGVIEYGADNVILLERSYLGHRLHFETVDYDSEANHLREGKPQEYERLKVEISKLQEEGLSQREIAKFMKMSVGKVNRIINMR